MKTNIVLEDYLDQKRLKGILKGISTISVAVIGDFCLDAYWMIETKAAEVSLETGKPTQPVRCQRYTLGGASNVVNNLTALGVKRVFALGVIGDDLFGRELVGQLSKIGVNTEGLLVQFKRWDTPVFGKPYLADEEQSRLDFGMFNVLEPETEQRLIDRFEQTLDTVQAVIINQQVVNSIYTGRLIKEVNRLISGHQDRYFVVDSRQNNAAFREVYLKLNQWEAARLAGMERSGGGDLTFEELIPYTWKIKELISAQAVFVTRGSKGLAVYNGREIYEVPGIQILKRVDPVGAGDTAVAALAACLACGAAVNESAQVTNFASAVTVQKLFECGTASPEEILQAGSSPDYIYHPELAEDLGQADYLKGTEIEIINRKMQTGYLKHVIFDHDGTISTLRHGWEQVMEPVMIKAILGDKCLGADEGLRQRVISRVREYIDKSTGIQTIIQMHHLVEMVKEFGCVPPDKVLDRFGYKKIYNDALMEIVSKRIDKFRSGELGVNDFTVKGAVGFLELLYNQGIRLYLASGTDEADVINETRLLGYARFFEEKIYGASGDIDNCSKRKVIDRILKENRLEGIELACFGDGPVELRETKKRGGLAIGVASDEVRLCGLNIEKRGRLIKAGADIIISDFSQAGALLEFLQEKVLLLQN